MNKWIKIVSILPVIALGLCACTLKETSMEESPAVEQPLLDADVCQGELLVCFDARVSDIIEQAGLTKSGIGAPVTRSGLLKVDEVLDLVKGYHIERVFPVNPKTEDKAREAGMHLWYLVRFSDEHPVEQVAANLSKLGEVSGVSFNRRLKKTEEKGPMPLTLELLNALKTTSPDPLYGLQWHLKNDGSLDSFLTEKAAGAPAKFVAGSDINAEGAWDKCTGHPSIIVAVVDEGVDVIHPDLAESMWENPLETYGARTDADKNGYEGDRYGYNFVKNSGYITVNDRYDSGHGTHVAGAIAARNNNGKGIRSIAGGDGSKDSGVRIMSCQIFAGAYAGTLLDEVRAIKYAADNGAVILQCSWGYISGAANPYEWGPQFTDDDNWILYNPLEKRTLDYFVKNAGSPDGVIDGGIVVYASGNESAAASSYPGAYKDYVSVAAIAGDYSPAVYTNYGPGTTISAPGGDQDYYYDFAPKDDAGRLLRRQAGSVGCILSTLPEHVTDSLMKDIPGDFKGYGYMEGTSMACPQVSGVVALGLSYALEQRKHFKAQDFIKLLHDTARPIDDMYLPLENKKWYKYITEMGNNHPMSTPMNQYKGKMGHGLVDATALLAAIDKADAPKMTFPNVVLSVSQTREYIPSHYFAAKGNFQLSVENAEVATATYDAVTGRVCIKALKKGSTKATITLNAETQSFVINVREAELNGGWL